MRGEIVLEAKGINKYFFSPAKTQVLKEVTFQITKGEFVSVVGKSGCGKSTLLYILSTMDTDYEGMLLIDKEEMSTKSHQYHSKIRNEKIGFVFQFHYLLNEFSVLENVMIPGLKLGKYPRPELEHRAMEKLKIFGMQEHAL
jgi:lipoprotein-releasing system ATP-binding protein